MVLIALRINMPKPFCAERPTKKSHSGLWHGLLHSFWPWRPWCLWPWRGHRKDFGSQGIPASVAGLWQRQDWKEKVGQNSWERTRSYRKCWKVHGHQIKITRDSWNFPPLSSQLHFLRSKSVFSLSSPWTDWKADPVSPSFLVLPSSP